MNHVKQMQIFNKLASSLIIKFKKLKLNSINSANKNYFDIPFDVIKRGPLLVLIVGLLFSCLSFAIEITVFVFVLKN